MRRRVVHDLQHGLVTGEHRAQTPRQTASDVWEVRMKTFNHILVPTDFSDTARDALLMARTIAEGTQARLSVLHVIADVWRQPWVGLDPNRWRD
jgi:hypothetical protein